MIVRTCTVLLSVVLGVVGARGAIVWPSSSSYSAAGGNAVSDNAGDISGTSSFDIIGDSSYPALQYSQDSTHFYLRLQVAESALPPAPTGSYMFYIDRTGLGTIDYPDFALAWDSQSNDPSKHGLEMTEWLSGDTWATMRMDDVDGSFGTKGAVDINGDVGRADDGGYRVVTGTGVGVTTRSYVEVAVSWNYLENVNYANSADRLGANQTWRVAAGTIPNQTDHSTISPNGDILGFNGLVTTTPLSQSWSVGIGTVPEIPASPWMVLGFAGIVALGSRLRAMRFGKPRARS